MNNWLWRYKVIDALTASNLEDALCLEKKPEQTSERTGISEQDSVWHHKILFNIRYQVSCDDQDFNDEDMGDP